MSYASLGYYALLFVVVILYYVIPPKQRWIVLLVGSGLFYILAAKDILVIAVFLGTGIISYIGGISLEMKRRRRNRNKAWLWLFCLASAAPCSILWSFPLGFPSILCKWWRILWIYTEARSMPSAMC